MVCSYLEIVYTLAFFVSSAHPVDTVIQALLVLICMSIFWGFSNHVCSCLEGYCQGHSRKPTSIFQWKNIIMYWTPTTWTYIVLGVLHIFPNAVFTAILKHNHADNGDIIWKKKLLMFIECLLLHQADTSFNLVSKQLLQVGSITMPILQKSYFFPGPAWLLTAGSSDLLPCMFWGHAASKRPESKSPQI